MATVLSADRSMARALVLARRGMGSVRPNPPVGAVLVRDGRIVGEGFHTRAGGDHAEVLALKNAGDRARGATLFVSLEPCNHHGATPPCVDALINAGVSTVQYAAADPNRASGSGAAALREAGLEVIQGPRSREAACLIAGFESRIHRSRPRFALKIAASLDGRIATSAGDSRWISSEVARAWVHRRRREADAVLVGAETAARDNPALTTRAVEGRSPDRIVCDSRLRVSPRSRVWKDDGTARIAATTDAAEPAKRKALEDQGVTVWVLPGDERGRVDLGALSLRLGEAGYNTVLVEGGGMLAGALLDAQLVDVIWIAMSRKVILGGDGRGWTDGLSVSAVSRAVKIARSEVQNLGPDWFMTLIPEAAQWWDPEVVHV